MSPLTHVSEVIEEFADTIVVVEESVPCGWVLPQECGLPAVWDVLFVCEKGCEITDHLCEAHRTLFVAHDKAGKVLHHHEPDDYFPAHIVAAYPRRTS